MVDTLWFLDGHHHVLCKRGHKIPESLKHFIGYNTPEASKHRKRSLQNLSEITLRELSNRLFTRLQDTFWERSGWKDFKSDIKSLATSMSDYAAYLKEQNKKTKYFQSLTEPVHSIADNLDFRFLPHCEANPSLFIELESLLHEKDSFQFIVVEDVCPTDPRRKYDYLQALKSGGLAVKAAMLTYRHGNNIGNTNCIWKVPEQDPDSFSQSQQTIEIVKKQIPTFHTRTMRRSLMQKYGRVAPNIKPAVLRSLYRDLTDDSSAATNQHTAEVDERVRLILDMEDPDVVLDLRALNTGHKSQYDVFLEECKKFLEEEVGTPVDDRRHDQVVHLARAISARDLLEQVKTRCPEDTKIPSEPWLRLQFWPKTKHAHSKIHYTGKLKVKFMVQARQFRKSHPDAHYAAALFRYQRELAVKFRSFSNFACVDDKHRVKVGEPGFPVAAAERGWRVLVSLNSSFQVGDHDFTQHSIVPSVCFLVDIPETVESSWYTGQVVVGLKEGAFEPSSPARHCTELGQILSSRNLQTKPILFLYSDGGPDHRLTYLSVQMSLILKYYLDFLCVARTAPFHSWRNPVERIMSLLNIGLQSIGLMRKQMDDEFEAAVAKCKNMKQLRAAAENNPTIKDGTLDSIAPVKVLISSVFHRLSLKEKKIESFAAATTAEIEEFLSSIKLVDETVTADVKWVKAVLPEYPKIKAFIEHCCQLRHYSFCIKKCGKSDCRICKPPRLPSDVLEDVKFLPDPEPNDDGHYKPFDTVYGKTTSEKHRPTLQKRPGRLKTLPFVASVQHARNTNMMIQCEECEMWRLVYSKCKLTAAERLQLDNALSYYTYTCGATLSDLDFNGRLADVCIRDVQCYDPLEKLYFSMNKDLICIYCCGSANLITKEGCYPQCNNCESKPPVQKRM